jgi:NADH:ubiquinone oxidoreductase subunit F (NADH-binding)
MNAMTLDSDQRLLASGAQAGSAADLTVHLAVHGALNIPAGDQPNWRAGILAAIDGSGLLGRGGAGFRSAAKWRAVERDTQPMVRGSRSPMVRGSRTPMVVVNAMEGEPASAKDRVLLTDAPHLVLDGAEVAAAVVGASEIVVCVPDHARSPAASIEAAIVQRRSAGHRRARVSVQRPPGRYVTGEESALVGWLDKRCALPVLRVDKSVPMSVGRRPVLLHNAETLAQVALIARHGPEWFRRLGSADAPGSTLVTVSGAVVIPGVVEVELGTPVADIVNRAGVEAELSAVLLGGYGGAWIDASRLSTPYAPAPLAAVGATLGVGVVIALPSTSCGIAETARVVRYMAGESAGQCGPCVFGLPAIADDLELLWAGRTDERVLERIERRARQVEGRGACRHPDGVVRLVRSAMSVFAADARDHARGHPCSGSMAGSVLTAPPTGVADRRAS